MISRAKFTRASFPSSHTWPKSMRPSFPVLASTRMFPGWGSVLKRPSISIWCPWTRQMSELSLSGSKLGRALLYSSCEAPSLPMDWLYSATPTFLADLDTRRKCWRSFTLVLSDSEGTTLASFARRRRRRDPGVQAATSHALASGVTGLSSLISSGLLVNSAIIASTVMPRTRAIASAIFVMLSRREVPGTKVMTSTVGRQSSKTGSGTLTPENGFFRLCAMRSKVWASARKSSSLM
mmetsp:Transcript_19483/g.51571  ORF Transcript_19483/g.51571 Transcript_19483/m.51571 type:complete len:237 (+) Transcript_19483:722-1432(+)